MALARLGCLNRKRAKAPGFYFIPGILIRCRVRSEGYPRGFSCFIQPYHIRTGPVIRLTSAAAHGGQNRNLRIRRKGSREFACETGIFDADENVDVLAKLPRLGH